ncbi:ImmA/IrrE family metallo-endopeptidase [Rheinheimera sp. NSM]|uniref:ImmA/IrrE family metallo-endopeptidase n=1 Tax=Rheinheimera sp. NSM TaxID=3457884 RepID=UPI004036EBBF
MPAKLVSRRFNERFPPELLQRDNLQHLLNRSKDKRVEKELSTKRGLARALAGLDSINGEAVFSLAEQFKVSREAMAIRLEELDLIPEY